MRIEPEDDELYRALPRLKESLQVNIELASPPDFIPELPDWRALEVRHFDPYSQALSKIERGVEHGLYRYPALDATAFRRKVEAAVRAYSQSDPHKPDH